MIIRRGYYDGYEVTLEGEEAKRFVVFLNAIGLIGELPAPDSESYTGSHALEQEIDSMRRFMSQRIDIVASNDESQTLLDSYEVWRELVKEEQGGN